MGEAVVGGAWFEVEDVDVDEVEVENEGASEVRVVEEECVGGGGGLVVGSGFGLG